MCGGLPGARALTNVSLPFRMQAAVTYGDPPDPVEGRPVDLKDLPLGWVRIPISIDVTLTEEILEQARHRAAQADAGHRARDQSDDWSPRRQVPVLAPVAPRSKDWQDFNSFLDFLGDPASSPAGQSVDGTSAAADIVPADRLRIDFDEATLDRAVDGSFRDVVARALAEDDARRARASNLAEPVAAQSINEMPVAQSAREVPDVRATDGTAVASRAGEGIGEVVVAGDVAAIQAGMAKSRPSLFTAGNIQLAQNDPEPNKDDSIKLDGDLDQTLGEFRRLQY